MVQICCEENARGGRGEGGKKGLFVFLAIPPIVPATLTNDKRQDGLL